MNQSLLILNVHPLLFLSFLNFSLLIRSPTLLATTTGTDWTTGTTGTLTLLDSTSVSITLTNIESPSISLSNLSDTTKFCPPLASSQERISYWLTTASNWTATFNSPVSNLLLYTTFLI